MTEPAGQFGGELSKELADRWLSLLALPGAMFLAIAATAQALGQVHALDVARLIREVTAWAHGLAASSQFALLAAVLAASMAIGLVARALGAAIERAILAADWPSWPGPGRAFARHRTDARQSRWDEVHRKYSAQWAEAADSKARGRRIKPGKRRDLLRARTAIAAERPERPTWSGDRVQAVAVRLLRDHRLDVGLLWPYIWLILPEQDRKEIRDARTAVDRAAELGAWAVLYAPLASIWWPAGIIALTLVATAQRRIRAATDEYAQLVEATVRLHARDLAKQIGLETPGPLPPDAGDQLSKLLDSSPSVTPGPVAAPSLSPEPGGP